MPTRYSSFCNYQGFEQSGQLLHLLHCAMNVSELEMNKFGSLNSKAIYPRTRKICLPGMVTREFEIVGENVVDAGLRPGLIDKSVDYYVSVHISHQSKNIVKVIINGDNESINEFVDIIQREDVRVKKDTPKTYQVSELKEYLGPEIDWNRYEIRFMSKQIYKGFREANARLSEIEHKLKMGNV